jgi:murein L,D-transpeptidase YcbB/YkuD
MRAGLQFGVALLAAGALSGPAAAHDAPAPAPTQTTRPAVEPAHAAAPPKAAAVAAPPQAATEGKPAAPAPAAALPVATAPSAPAVDATPKPKPKPAGPPPPIAVSQDSRPTLDAATFINTTRAADAYLRIVEAGGWPTLPPGTVLKAGDTGPLVVTLRQRLAAERDLPPDAATSPTFDSDLAKAVKRFQVRYGLPESGAVREKTLQALNVPATTRQRQLAASAQRLIGSNFPFGERYVVVNIPSAAVEAVEGGQVARRYVAVVGKADRASPTVEARIAAVNLNPTWTVPVSLIKKDIIPHVRKDPGYLAKMKIRLLDGKGQEVEPQTIDWSTEKAVNYTVRQDPGAINSLGQIRIDMPNRHAVYMHDTPTKRLFAQGARFHSSGCVRVADVRDFAEWLLRGTPGPRGAWTKPEIDAGIATGARQDIKLAKAIPVAWVYLTGYAMADGSVHFREDVYGLDTEKPILPPAPDPLDPPVTSSLPRKRI